MKNYEIGWMIYLIFLALIFSILIIFLDSTEKKLFQKQNINCIEMDLYRKDPNGHIYPINYTIPLEKGMVFNFTPLEKIEKITISVPEDK